MTIVWLFLKDFTRLYKYHKNGTLKTYAARPAMEWTILFLTKAFYIGYIFVLPMLVTPLLWWQILIGIFGMHYIAGFILAIIFQPAHVIEGHDH